MKLCNKCGASNKDNNQFCSSCGQRLGNMVGANQVQQTNPSSVCQITFRRPYGYAWGMLAFHIKVDNSVSYELKNGGEINIPMSPGQHSISISVFSYPQKKRFNFNATGNMTFICQYTPAGVVTWLAVPVKVTDSNGREY